MSRTIQARPELADFVTPSLLRTLRQGDLSKLTTIIAHVCDQLFQMDMLRCRHYTNHSSKHFSNVARNMADIVVALPKGQRPKTKELFCLLASAWLHDVGMQTAPADEDCETVRRLHNLRSSDYVEQHSEALHLQDDHPSRQVIRLLCESHTRVDLLADERFREDRVIENERIRIRLLAAILRLADELDLTYGRAPNTLRELMGAALSPESLRHWLKHHYVHGVSIQKSTEDGQITLLVNVQVGVPDEFHRDEIFVPLVCNKLEAELAPINDIFAAEIGRFQAKPKYHILVEESESISDESLSWFLARSLEEAGLDSFLARLVGECERLSSDGDHFGIVMATVQGMQALVASMYYQSFALTASGGLLPNMLTALEGRLRPGTVARIRLVSSLVLDPRLSPGAPRNRKDPIPEETAASFAGLSVDALRRLLDDMLALKAREVRASVIEALDGIRHRAGSSRTEHGETLEIAEALRRAATKALALAYLSADEDSDEARLANYRRLADAIQSLMTPTQEAENG